MKRIAMLGLMVAACTPGAPDAPQRPAPPERPGDAGAVVEPATPCRIEAAAGLIGKPFTPALQKDAQASVGARAVRVIRPDTAVTMDYRPDRLNIDVDAGGIVRGFRCG